MRRFSTLFCTLFLCALGCQEDGSVIEEESASEDEESADIGSRILADSTASIMDSEVPEPGEEDTMVPDATISVDMCPNPEEELCNGLDDDCDGRVDEDYNIGMPCMGGRGICAREGVYECLGERAVRCSAEPGNGTTEYCNALDDDCDGRTDETYENLGFACEITEGACASSGRVRCGVDLLSTICDAPPIEIEEERCDNIDNDCDGSTDEGIDVGALCEAGEGLCRRGGFIQCSEDGDVLCTAMPGPPRPEACDGFDNDCDGVPDEDFGGGFCNVGVGACNREGFIACNAEGELVCNAVAGEPGFETCNALDDDCDGSTDEVWPDLGQACTSGLGICAQDGIVSCTEENPEGGGLAFQGVQQNVNLPELERQGFEVCWQGQYNQSGVSIEDVLSDCDQGVLMMACRRVNTPQVLNVAAMGLRDEVLTDVGPGANAVHEHNGVQWYFHNSRSWGFAPLGAMVSRNSCDTGADRREERICWHTNNGRINSGYSCGAQRGNLAGYERLILHRPAGPVGECTAEAGEPEEAEICNGLDDDCDGVTDEGIDGVELACELDGLEPCQIAVTQCTPDGEIICAPRVVEPQQEACNAWDDDCDGSVDEDFPDLGSACTEGIGECRQEGTFVCSGEGRGGGPLHFEGIRQDVPEAELTAAGFERCWSGAFGSVAEIPDIQEACGEGEWIMGCRPNGQASLNIAANGLREEILTDVGVGREATHEHNGVSWYYNPSRSWGFAALNTGVSRNSCDTAQVQPELRMCWHTSNNRVTSGYRCGRTTLNGNNGWERIIFHRPEVGRQVCSVQAGDPAESELCNQLDDDCDGATDENVDGAGVFCEIDDLQVCERAVVQCTIDGDLACAPLEVEPQEETCNDFDDDCDGFTDEDFPELGADCAEGVGACARTGTFICSGEDRAQDGLLFQGVQEDVAMADLEGAGFETCWSGQFNGSAEIAAIQAGCGDGEWVMGCRPQGQESLNLAATGLRDEILTDVGIGVGAVHDHNGVSWYYNANRSWGFAPLGSGVNRSRCDTSQVQPNLRMCWPTINNRVTSGYRCGPTNQNINAWERVIMHRPEGGKQVCDAIPGPPAVEECNAIDDDCDGVTDEELDGTGIPCELDGLNACQRAQTVCNEMGEIVCGAVDVDPQREICNGIDDDCDGQTDEDFEDLGDICTAGEGVCRQEGVVACVQPEEGGGLLAFEGIRQNVPEAELADLGFELCWQGFYNGSEPMAPILEGCNLGELLWGCKQNGQDALLLAATGERAEVLTDTGRERAGVHNHNGVDWYYSDSYSLGFAPEGIGVSRSSCDTSREQTDLRMCWHSSGARITSGYRCGNNFLNGNALWTRVIYHRVPGGIAQCNASPADVEGEEVCNQLDDDCDGQVDEGLNCAGEVP